MSMVFIYTEDYIVDLKGFLVRAFHIKIGYQRLHTYIHILRILR